MKNALPFLLLSISGLNAFGQTWTAGPKIAFGLSTSIQGDELRVGTNGVDLEATLTSSTTLFGGFVRHDRAHWYGQAEGLVGKAGTSLIRSSALVGSGSDFLTGKRADARVLAGVKPMPWLRLYAGAGYARLNWTIRDYDSEVAFAEQAALERPASAQDWLARADFARFSKAVDQSYRRNILTGQAGLGIDVQGFMIDLTYSQSLTPLVDGITVNNRSYAARQQYRNFALSIGYQLLPAKAFATASRKSNRAYERIKQDVPYYRNEFHASAGLLGEDIGSAFIYENRYTRYLTRRVGLTAGVNMTRLFEDYDTGFLPKLSTTFMLTAGVRLLPLYSRRHTIGLTTGPLLQYETGVSVSSGGTRNVNGQPLKTINLRADSDRTGLTVGWHSSLDYQFAVTDRLLVGPWLRVFGQDFIVPDYASAGLQIGYRF